MNAKKRWARQKKALARFQKEHGRGMTIAEFKKYLLGY